MSFLAPAYLIAGLGVAGAVLGLHFIVMRQPPSEMLPTARFIPLRPAQARTVERRPDDVPLLLARLAAIVLLGAAFARPIQRPAPGSVLRIAVADRSRAIADPREVADSVRRLRPTVVIAFDSATRVIESGVSDSLVGWRRGTARGAISPALVSALRAASRLGAQADSIEVTVVSPVASEEMDAATDSIRALWPGEIRLVRVTARVDSVGQTAAVLDWPDDGHAVGARARVPVDTVSAVVATGGRAVLVAPFARAWRIDTVGARVVARWVDGEPAAVERVVGVGCNREITVPRPTAGDLTSRAEFRRFGAAMARPCGTDGDDTGRLPMATVAWRDDSTRARLVPSRAIVSATSSPSPLAQWLLAAALVALVIEPVVRRWPGA